ncbi:MAG: radical SAM protein, partial [bacterium]
MQSGLGQPAEAAICRIPPNYGLSYLSSYYRLHGKFHDRVRFVMADENTGAGNALDVILKESPDIVGISSTSMFIDLCVDLAMAVRKHCPRTVIIGGGVHFHLYPTYLIKERVFDYVCTGEGEIVFCQFLDAYIEQGGGPDSATMSKIRGMSYMDGDVVQQAAPPPIVDATEIPDPDLDLLDVNHYFSRRTAYGRSHFGRCASLVTSRGCPFACAFCYNNLRKTPVRYISAERVVGLMRLYAERFKTQYFDFSDDLFLGDKKRVEVICRMLLADGPKVSWACNGRAELIKEGDRDLLELMQKAGCIQMQFGFESGSDRIIKILKGKSASVAGNQRALDHVRAAGIDVAGYFMVGVPSEKPEDVENTK